MKHSDALKALAPVDLSMPSLEALAYLLRHQELWPATFEWDYYSYSNCAVGLAAWFWDGQARPEWIKYTLDLDSVRRLFKRAYFFHCSPAHVARRIDRHLEEVRS